MRSLIEPPDLTALPGGCPSRWRQRVARALAGLTCIAGVLVAGAMPARADFVVNSAEATINNEKMAVTFEMDLDLSDQAEEALDRGIPLIISVRVELDRDRRILWNDRVVDWQSDFEIHFHALSQRYVVQETGRGGIQDFATVEDAMRAIGGTRTINVPVPKIPTNPDLRYEIEIRARLEIESLPTPLRLMAYLSPGWRLSTGSSKWPVQH